MWQGWHRHTSCASRCAASAVPNPRKRRRWWTGMVTGSAQHTGGAFAALRRPVMEGGVTLPWTILTAAGSAYVSLLRFVRFLYERERREDKEEIRELKHL